MKGLFSKIFQSQTAKTIIVVTEVAALLSLAVVTWVIIDGRSKGLFTEETTMYVVETSAPDTTLYDTGNNWFVNDNTYSSDNANISTPDNNNYTPGVQFENNQGQAQQNVISENVSGWSTAKILSTAANAVNKTKAYNSNVTVNHRESFNATVTECTGGTIVQSVANMMVGWVVKPVDETLNFSNGKAVNSEGETVSLILPQKNGFNLTEDGVKSASVNVVNNEYVIKINLVQESAGMYDVPRHNASAIGYLDVANFDLSFLTVESALINYKGSSVELHINSQGYVTYAEYHIPLLVKGSGNGAGISGSVTFDGEQTEVWSMNY